MEIGAGLQCLRSDNTSGATGLLELALDILETFATQPPADNTRPFRTALEALIGALLAAQPSMAVLITLAQQVLQACPPALPPLAAGHQLRQALSAFRQQTSQSLAGICRQALAVLPPQATVLTYSNSTTVLAALRAAHDRGRLRRVLLSESRPAYDGRPQALALLEHGIAVEYSTDMGLLARLPEAQAVFVGADAVLPDDLLNKLGTRALAQAARLHGLPIFSLCARSKFLPAAARPLLRIVDHAGEEVWPAAPAAVRIWNPYFELTPLALFSAILCESETLSPEALSRFLQQQALDPVLLRLASGRVAGDHHRELPADGTVLKVDEEG